MSKLANTTPRSVRILVSDMDRISKLYAVPGIHGRVTKMAMDGVHLLTYIEEIERGRENAPIALREAIHTLRTALDRRDNRTDDQGQVSQERSATEEDDHQRHINEAKAV